VYWDIKAQVHPAKDKKALFDARLTSVKGTRVAGGKDFDGLTGKLIDSKKVALLDDKKAKSLAKDIETKEWKVTSVEEKTFNSKPAIPFITSTLQMEANRKLGMSSKDTMRTAQRLYEEGLITYMRTDSPSLS